MINAFSALGRKIKEKLDAAELDHDINKAYHHNQWFTPENTRLALESIADNYLAEEKLHKWLSNYEFKENSSPKTVALVMAGNIPLVGWHDLMCILLTGNNAQVKLSAKDEVLPKMMIRELEETEPGFKDRIKIVERLQGFDAVIATGSTNTARYFEYYFGKYPHIIRKNRNSVAIITGKESKEELFELGKDIFEYFGLGCRNVCKLFVPKGYDFTEMLDTFAPYRNVADHYKYENNYSYHKSIWLLNRDPHLDTGFLILKKDEKLASPTASVYYEEYDNLQEVEERFFNDREKIQCIVGSEDNYLATVPFGHSQSPELWDYADGVDTIAFLLSLQKK